MMKTEQIKDSGQFLAVLEDFENVFQRLSSRVSLIDYAKKTVKYGNVFVVYNGEKPAALIAFYNNDLQSKNAFVTLVGVKSEYRRRHLGTQLLALCENDAKNAGMKTISLEVRKEKDGAIAFYSDNGYKEYKRSNEAVFMKKDLNI